MDNAVLCRCGEELNQSIVFKDDDVKSCPNCSVQRGVHVFYEYEAFGTRNDNGTVRVQSHCTACRNHGRMGYPNPFMTCG